MSLRHARQMRLPEVGAEGQARLARAHVLIVGLGGLGVPALQYLTGAGIGQLTLIDSDRVEASNLHRQTIYGAALGQPKAEAAAAFARTLAPEARVTAYARALTPGLAPGLIAQADLVLDCADSHAVSYLLSDLCKAAAKPLISASALGHEGYVGGFCGPAPSLRALFPLPENGQTCASAGVLGPVVGTMGALQAQMALMVLLGSQPSPLGQLMRFDLRRWHMASFRFDNAPEPEHAAPFLDHKDLQPEDLVIDLRSAAEAPEPIHPAARRLPSPDTLAALRPEHPGQRLVLGCASGLRAIHASTRTHPDWGPRIALMAASLIDPSA